MPASARAVFGDRGEVGEPLENILRGNVGEAEAAHSRRVDDPAAFGQGEGHGRCRGVPSLAGHRVHVPRCPVGIWNEGVDEGGFADSRMPDEYCFQPGQCASERGQISWNFLFLPR